MNLKCPRCDAAMEEGFLFDMGGGNSVPQPQWVAGKPEPSFWTGLKLRGRVRFDVVTYRCPRCRRLESFAPSSPAQT